MGELERKLSPPTSSLSSTTIMRRPGRLLAKQPPEENAERCGVEDRAHHPYELSGIQTDGAKTGHRLSGRRMAQDRVLDFGRYPHAAAGAMLLEVTFIQTPQFDAEHVNGFETHLFTSLTSNWV